MSRDWLLYLDDVIDSAEKIQRFLRSATQEKFSADELLFDAIRQNKPYNESKRCANATMAGILGRMAAARQRPVTWPEMMASNTPYDGRNQM